ncbi:hypothetical protein ACFQ3L_03835 [Lacticaseibacillus jixianensis]|uniref:WxL domain-containing protein n=1 Tax=Lacticaseibacillus jixianensis TaxID=2486012 RepID=A0ABW4B743_9LACO|nr:hypothetical protein [Lacticaseibacillus jixianensis]
MRKWWLAVVVAAAMLFAGGRRVMALPYDKLLFEGVSWQPGPADYGLMFATPDELWVRVDTTVNVYYSLSIDSKTNLDALQALKVERLENDLVVQDETKEVTVGKVPKLSVTTGYLVIAPKTLGTRQYRITNTAPRTFTPYTRTLTLHVVNELPPDLSFNANGLKVFDFVPLQVFAVDSKGHKYAVVIEWRDNIDGGYKPIADGPLVLSSYKNISSVHYKDVFRTDSPGVVGQRLSLGRFQVIHEPDPISVNQRGEATVQLPVIVPPVGEGQVRLVWLGPKGDRHVLPIDLATGTVHFTGLTPASFPMTWRIEYKAKGFDNDNTVPTTSFTYPDIQGQFTTPLTLDLPVALAPLFTGTYTLQQLAEGPVSVVPAWESLAITASGRWLLQLDIDAPAALPMRLRLGEQETGRGEPPLRVSGQDSQDVSLAASRLIIPQTRVLSPGTYTAQITFTLIRAPNP